ncbi:hypothetical protein S40285_03280 [Stachybotrys chlorohalonatus IBT 40285]|uniref:NTF2 domain-containing protein n=1 Tax=Stachybotrys chlorohalonatus (strain IBT 40285) TaxID=1283841 RepID=A0A084QGV2_STAC4|nr:hypothetical protein S40285_03280 [Stachybotrys chlorohalonata IBT 40285]
MAATYKQFLAAPSSSLLADKASLHYVTTTTSFHGPTDIIKHLNALQKQVKKKHEDVLSLVDGQTAIAVEVDTLLEFQTSGGIYLPGLDDNFLTDREANLAITHFVFFDSEGKIAQIRQQWDQGSLLKQLDIIGRTGRNWPIRDCKEQLTLIQSSLKASGAIAPTSGNQRDLLIRTRGNSTNALRDPHASLHMTASREEIEAEAAAAVVSPYAGANRPQQRSFTEILGDEPDSPSANRQRNHSPSKAGQGKNFQPMRLFEGQEHHEDEEEETPKKGTKQYIRPNPTKFNHFDFADGSDPQDSPQRGVSFDEKPKTKHDSQWSFDDFVTPQKAPASKTFRHQDVRHWDTEAGPDEDAPQQAGKGRRDAETHFELQDDGEQVPRHERPNARPRGSTHNDGLGLYKNQLLNQEGADPGSQRALGNITNLKDRGKDFDAHFAMVDESPARGQPQRQPVPEARKKAVKMMDSNWSAYDESPVQKENKSRSGETREDSRIHIAGDGMGGKKGTNRDWLYGHTDETEETPQPANRKPNHAAQQKSFWDF